MQTRDIVPALLLIAYVTVTVWITFLANPLLLWVLALAGIFILGWLVIYRDWSKHDAP